VVNSRTRRSARPTKATAIPSHAVLYDAMNCPKHPNESLFLIRNGVSVYVCCTPCGVRQSIMTTRCAGSRCGREVFYGGVDGTITVATATGKDHRLDCLDDKKFTQARPRPQ
jgi:hypothetical protein